MNKFDVLVELSSGAKDTFTLTAKNEVEAKSIARNRVDIILGTNKMNCTIKSMEVREWDIE